MSKIFKEDLIKKVRTNPVFNQVFQDPHIRRYQYTALVNVRPSAQGLARAPDPPDPLDEGDWKWDEMKEFDELQDEVHEAVYKPTVAQVGGMIADRLLGEKPKVTDYYDTGNLYWENMVPRKLYNQPTVIIHENPQLKKLTGAKIRVSNTFQSFSK